MNCQGEGADQVSGGSVLWACFVTVMAVISGDFDDANADGFPWFRDSIENKRRALPVATSSTVSGTLRGTERKIKPAIGLQGLSDSSVG